MNRFLISTACTAMLLNLCVGAQAANAGEAIGNIYTTDIVAYIDDMPIKSYNIGGRTVIQLEDLRAYGFDVEWNSGERYLSVAVKDRPGSAPQAEINKQTPGNVAGTIYATDIRVGINGVDCSFIDTYNIGGITCMAVEDLGTMDKLSDGSPMYSRFAMHYTYNDDERAVRLYTLREGDEFETEYGTAAVRKITSDYRRLAYRIKNEETEYDPGFTVYSAAVYDDESSIAYCAAIEELSQDMNINAGMDNGVYSIISSDEGEITFISTMSYNGAIHNDRCILALSLPVNVNGEYIADGEPNCMICLNSYEPDYKTVYMSMDFLEKYTGYKFDIS